MLLFSTEVSPWAIIAFIWLALQVFGFLTRKTEPPGPPGGRVVAIHNDTEWADAQRDAKDSGTLVRRTAACFLLGTRQRNAVHVCKRAVRTRHSTQPSR
jgi:hypothetical protein